jgi:hypothetical protein
MYQFLLGDLQPTLLLHLPHSSHSCRLHLCVCSFNLWLVYGATGKNPGSSSKCQLSIASQQQNLQALLCIAQKYRGGSQAQFRISHLSHSIYQRSKKSPMVMGLYIVAF